MTYTPPAGVAFFTTSNATTTRPAPLPTSGVLGGHRLALVVGGVMTAAGDVDFTADGWTLIPGASILDDDSTTGVRTKLQVLERIAAGPKGQPTTEPASYTVTATGITGKFGGGIVNLGNHTGPVTVGTQKGTGTASLNRSVSVTFTGDPRVLLTAYLDAGNTAQTPQDPTVISAVSSSSSLAVAIAPADVAAGTVTRTATSPLNTSAWSALALAVALPDNLVPTVTADPAIPAAEADSSVRVSITATDPDGTIVTYTASSSPALTLTPLADEPGAWTFTAPMSITDVTYTVTMTATDNRGAIVSATQDVTVKACPNQWLDGTIWRPAVRRYID